ncbi:MAG: SRPBCC domain-containing protein [Acidobacteriia bacterium]|nr:SRPBCC domain-containing protein [Terriglobia bacterium]
MEKQNANREPVRQSVHVDCPREDAFRLFTEALSEWWPRELGPRGGGDYDEVVIEPWEGGRVFERTRSGKEQDWGSVTVWEPPRRLEFTWHPDAPRDDRQTVTVDFRTEADGTRVTLTHHGWHLAGVATCLAHFGRFITEQMLVAF